MGDPIGLTGYAPPVSMNIQASAGEEDRYALKGMKQQQVVVAGDHQIHLCGWGHGENQVSRAAWVRLSCIDG